MSIRVIAVNKTNYRPLATRIVILVLVNIFVFFVLFNLAYWSLPLAMLAKNRLASGMASSSGLGSTIANDDVRSTYPNYAAADWARQHFREFAGLKSDYKSYIGWRRQLYKGTTINISGRYAQRETLLNRTDVSKTAYFFGGSTMWGTGSRDQDTIPSLFAATTGIRSENFGETAYTAHQSLALLVQLLQDGHRPDIVIFYDGANEISAKCRTELTSESHVREALID